MTPGFTDTSTSACQFLTVILPTLPTTTSSIITGEFDSSVADIRDLDVIDRGTRAAAHGSGQRQRVQTVKGAAGHRQCGTAPDDGNPTQRVPPLMVCLPRAEARPLRRAGGRRRVRPRRGPATESAVR